MTLEILRSLPLTDAGFVHGFTTRRGGTSAAPFDGSNFGRGLGDDEAAVDENRRRLARRLGFEVLFEVTQVHGGSVHALEPSSEPKEVSRIEADALVSDPTVRGAVSVRTADCVPILVGHPPSGRVAAIHAGWRGTEAGVLANALERLGHPGSELVAAIGPHIRAARFEVGEDVAMRLGALAGDREVIDRTGAKARVDLTAIVVHQLECLDVGTIDVVQGCTFEDAERFFSYRRDGAASGRHLAVIVPRAQVESV